MLAAGFLIDVIGVRVILVGGSLITAAAVGSLGLRRTFGRAFGSLLLAGLGSAGLSTAAILLMPHAFFGADRLASASIDLGCVFMALGALITPVLSDVLIRLMEFRRAAVVLAVLCLAPAFLAILGGPLPEAPQQAVDFGELLSNADLWLIGLLFLFYAPLEASLSVWATTYLTDLGQESGGAVWGLSMFWAAFVASRLLAAAALHAAAKSYLDVWMLIGAGGLAAVMLGNLIGTGNKTAARLSLAASASSWGRFFPRWWDCSSVSNRSRRRARPMGLSSRSARWAVWSSPRWWEQERRSNIQGALYVPLLLALGLSAVALVLLVTASLS